MTISHRYRSLLFTLVSSAGWERTRRSLAEFRRRLTFRRHIVDVFLELDDPYSYILARYLDELRESFDIELRVHLTETRIDGNRPEPELWPIYAEKDCHDLARSLDIPFLDRGASPPVEHRRQLTAALATDSLSRIVEGLTAYWRGDADAVTRIAAGPGSADADNVIANNQRRLKKLGHYSSATVHYGGEWYWGVDRLHYLVDRLESLGLRTKDSPRLTAIRNVMRLDLPCQPPAVAAALPPLEFFFSFRSPYSYLAIDRARAIARAFGVELKIRLVLPMVMRGMQLSRAKALYIAFDTGREARRLGIPFGRFTDPVGPGIERCMAAARVARSENRLPEFIAEAGHAVFAGGIDVATDKGLRRVAAKAALFWPAVAESLQQDDWRPEVEAARAEMTESGSWGVPTFRIGDWVTWGQDRDWLVARHLEMRVRREEGANV